MHHHHHNNHHHHHHQSVLPKGRKFTASAGTLAAVLPKTGPPPRTQEPWLQFYQGLDRCSSSRCFPDPTLSLASEQTLKDPKVTNVEVMRVDLAESLGLKYE